MSIKTATLNGVATIEIARPEKKNALTVAMYQAMTDALVAAREDAAVRAVLITGQPGIFTSGNDIEDFMKRAPGQGSDAMDSPVFRFMRALLDCDKPVVAAVTGAAIGIGTTLLLHCDFVFVSDEARLAMPFVALGLVPEFASSLVVPQLMGHRRAAEKLLTGDPFTPEQAVECGIANAVLPAGERGELVLTTLTREGTPVLRYRTRDITYLMDEPCPCGRTSRRIHRLMGRNDDMLIIRGVNVFPQQVEEVLLRVEGVEPHYRLIVDREHSMDSLEVEVEMAEALFSDEVRVVLALERRVEHELRVTLGIQTTVRLVNPKSIARSEGKANRIVDRRSVTTSV